MSAAELAELQQKLRSLLPDPDGGLFAVLSSLKKLLPEGSNKHSTTFLLETRLNALNKDRIMGVLSQDDLQLAYNRITADLLALIDGLSEADFLPIATSGNPAKTGSILYRIPHTMEVEQDYKCVVRLAFDTDSVVKNIEITKDTVVKDVRVSEVMEVELLDPNETPSFAIRRLNSAEQFLEKNEYTEWVFFVKPLLIGTLPLVLKVSVKELINDRERIKEIVLEEVITVVTDPKTDLPNTDFQNAGYSISYSSSPGFQPSASNPKQRSALFMVLGLVVASSVMAAAGIALDIIKNPFKNKLIDPYPPCAKTDTAYIGGVVPKFDTIAIADKGVQNERINPDILPGAQPKPAVITKPNRDKSPKIDISSPVINEKTEPIDLKNNQSKGHNRKSGFEMVDVAGGNLPVGKRGCNGTESVAIRSFKIGKYEITQADWREIMGNCDAFNKGCNDCPMEQVSWEMAVEFAQKASNLKGIKYRLPYEAEWEFAARGGTLGKPHDFAGSDHPLEYAWFNTIQEYTHAVGTKQANELGIFDLSGNVWEWCGGQFPPYANCGQENDKDRGKRGGSWADKVKISKRSGKGANKKDADNGLRLVAE